MEMMKWRWLGRGVVIVSYCWVDDGYGEETFSLAKGKAFVIISIR